MTASERIVCARCGRDAERPAGSTYCGRAGRRAAKNDRYDAGRPDRVARRERRLLEAEQRADAWTRWRNATTRESRRRVPLDAASQAQARALLAAGVVAGYEDRAGRIRDVGVPKRNINGGALWSRQLDLERDERGRVIA